MINLNFNGDLPGGRTFDHKSQLIFPWYTKSFLTELTKWDISTWKVFEYGSGDSTIWWRRNCREVISVDTNYEWSQKTNSYFSDNKKDFIEFPLKFIDEELFDCIIIDGDPVEWRDDCCEISLKCLKKGGIIIADNYEQESINCLNWHKTNNFLLEKEKKVFIQQGHNDWKTCFWKI